MTLIPMRRTRQVLVGGVPVGGQSAVTVQAMAKTPTADIESTVREVLELQRAGAAFVRLAVPDTESVEALRQIKRRVGIPLVADIHFDYRIALGCLEAGADKLRINPGNLGGRENLLCVAKAARERCVPIRVGVNAGSLERDLLKKYGGPVPEAIAESAMRSAGMLADLGFEDIVISAKSSDVMTTVQAYRMISSLCDYPLHVGVTETGPGISGIVKSAAGIGTLLSQGIGDTIRVSLTAPAVSEVAVGHMILRSLGLARHGVDVISCPTCGRSRHSVLELAGRAQQELADVKAPLKVAIMACEVNGPGEAREADVGLAATRSGAVLFERGHVVATGSVESMYSALVQRVRRLDTHKSPVDLDTGRSV